MKLLGLCLLIAAGGGVGCMRVAALRGRVKALSTALRFVDWWMREVQYTAAPIQELLARAKQDASFCELLDFDGKQNYFTEEDEKVFRQFMDGLGGTDLEGQRSRGAFYKKLFEERVQEAGEVAACRGRTELMLWTGGTAVLALLLL